MTDVLRPHFLFRPTQIGRRVRFAVRQPVEEQHHRLPWGPVIAYDPRETVGVTIGRRGVFELAVCEALMRLSDSGETALDVGANIGQMTSVLAHSVGSAGKVVSFEPHPVVFERLRRNVRSWAKVPTMARIDPRPLAVSDHDGTETLSSRYFEINQGSASLERVESAAQEVDAHRVAVRRLDAEVGAGVEVGTMKLDIEGHELSALAGAKEMLGEARVRDIVFEEQRSPPTPVTLFLEGQGYSIYRLGERLSGPTIEPVRSADAEPAESLDYPPSLLATRDPDRALRRIGLRGWAVYGVGAAGRAERDRRFGAENR